MFNLNITEIPFKITGKHISDVSSASATGLFDPFTMQWATWALNILKIPKNIFPRVVDTAGDFGNVRKEIFGVEIPIMCSVSNFYNSLTIINRNNLVNFYNCSKRWQIKLQQHLDQAALSQVI